MSDESERSVGSVGSVASGEAQNLGQDESEDICDRIRGWIEANDNARCLELRPDASFLLEDCLDEILRLRGSTVEQRFCEPTGAGSTPAAGFALKPEEREAIHWVIGDVADIAWPVEDTLRGLLERLK